ncbi:MAG: hypothetical protein WDW38_010122 [Sanguina aurantia]
MVTLHPAPVPLSTLQTELNSYLSLLKTKLVEVINEDYSDYVGLAGKLTGVEGAVLRMRRPLGELKDKLTVVQEAVRSELAALHQGLKRRKEVATARSLLELLQEVAHVASKVDKLLAEVAASDPSVPAATASHHSSDTYTASLTAAHPSSTPTPTPTPFITPNGGPEAVTDGGDLDAYARLLERVAGEVSRLAFLCARGKDLAFVKTLEPRVASSRADLSSRLHTALVAALTQQRHPATLHCLHACVELGCGEVAEGCVRTVVVAPLLQGCIAAHRKAHPRSGSREDELSSLLTHVLAAVHDALAPVLSAALSPHSALRSLDLLGSALLQEVQATLATSLPGESRSTDLHMLGCIAGVQATLAASLPGVFSPGIPPAFHANYLASLHFLESLEAMCHSRGSVDRLRASPAHAAFLRRWNLSVYFSLLYQEIAGELEEQTGVQRFHPAALLGPPSSASAPARDGSERGGPEAARDSREVTLATATGVSPHLSITHTLLSCLQRAVSSEVFLPSLGDRFFRLVLQLVQRYATWAAAAVAARSDPSPDPSPSLSSSQPAVSQGAGLGGLSGPGGQQTTNTSAAATSHGDGSEGEAGSADGGGSGGGHAMSWVAAASLEELSMLLHDCEAVAGVLASWLLPALQPYWDPWSRPLCCQLQQTGHPLMWHDSLLVPRWRDAPRPQRSPKRLAVWMGSGLVFTTVVRRSGAEAHPVQRLQPGAIASLTLRVVRVVNGRYRQLSEELLSTVRKTESSLKRLKKSRPGEGAEGAMADSDKIALQLHLDVQEYGRQITGLGLDPMHLASYKQLIDAVAITSPATAQPMSKS